MARRDGRPSSHARPAHQARVTRANLRLPTWSTTVSPRFTESPLSVPLSPLIRTPPCSIMRRPSEVLETSCDSLTTSMIAISGILYERHFHPPPGTFTLISDPL